MVHTRASARLVASRFLLDMPTDIALLCLGHVLDVRDRASVCLALPALGLAAMRELELYKGLLFDIAVWLASTPGAEIDEVLLRKFASDCRATVADCKMINEWACGSSSGCHIHLLPSPFVSGKWEWRLVLPIEGTDVMLRIDEPCGCVRHFCGPHGHLVRKIEHGTGVAYHYEGDVNEEHHVRAVHRDGVVQYFVGEQGEERIVRQVHPNGNVQHYEGEPGEERLVRQDCRHGTVMHFEGSDGHEHLVRRDLRNGNTLYYEAGRIIRLGFPNGTVRKLATRRWIKEKK